MMRRSSRSAFSSPEKDYENNKQMVGGAFSAPNESNIPLAVKRRLGKW